VPVSEFRKFMEEHAAFFGVVVPILAIVGAFLGSWAAGWMQARGGRDQAAAAREAAAATNEAQRVAALWTVRRIQVAELIQRANEVMLASGHAHAVCQPEEGDRDRVNDALRAMGMRESEIRLIAPAKVVDAAKKVARLSGTAWIAAAIQGPENRARKELRRLANEADLAVRDAAREAMGVIRNESSSVAEREQALSAVSGLSEEHVRRLTVRPSVPPPFSRPYSEIEHEYQERVDALVSAAREMLRSEDDVAPASPPQRRWWRRNSAATPAGSA